MLTITVIKHLQALPHIWMEINLSKSKIINQIVLQENIANGEKIRRFIVEAKVKGKWQTLVEGQSMGQKYIFVLPKEIKSKNFRVRVTEAISIPEFKLSVYNI